MIPFSKITRITIFSLIINTLLLSFVTQGIVLKNNHLKIPEDITDDIKIVNDEEKLENDIINPKINDNILDDLNFVNETKEEKSEKEKPTYRSWNSILKQAGLQSGSNNLDNSQEVLVEVQDNSVFMIVGEHIGYNLNNILYSNLIVKTKARVVETIRKLKATVVKVPIDSLNAFMEEGRNIENIRYIEPNGIIKADFIPNDPSWTSQWGPQRIHTASAWEIEDGRFEDVLVAIIDTGIDYTHPDLGEQYVDLGYDWVNNDNYPMDDKGHGTHCAGTIAASINNSIGIAGMANVKIMAEKFLNSEGSGSFENAAQAIIHAVDAGADILSNSWGSYYDASIVEDAFSYAAAHDVVSIAAAGNDNTQLTHYPSSYSTIISVSATDSADNRAWFSNYGSTIEVAAPGVDIYSTIPVSKGSYGSKSGTSMACPHVAGVAALIRSFFPAYTASQVRNRLHQAVDDLGSPGWDEDFGYGLTNAYLAVGPPPEHDLEVSLEVAPKVGIDNTITIDVSIENRGTNSENNIEVSLYFNETEVSNQIYSSIAADETIHFIYKWNTSLIETYDISAEITPVNQETRTFNNYDSKISSVCDPSRRIGFIYNHYESILNALEPFYEDLNYTTEAITTEITADLLTSYFSLFVAEGGYPWKTSEIAAVEEFIENGGIFIGIGNSPTNGVSTIGANNGIIYTTSSSGNFGPSNEITIDHYLMINVTTVYIPAGFSALELAGQAAPVFWDASGAVICGASVEIGKGRFVILAADFQNSLHDEDNEQMFANVLHYEEHNLEVELKLNGQTNYPISTTNQFYEDGNDLENWEKNDPSLTGLHLITGEMTIKRGTVDLGETCTAILNEEYTSLFDGGNVKGFSRALVDLSNWDGITDMEITFRFRATSGYGQSSVTNFALGFYNLSEGIIPHINPTGGSQYNVAQSQREGQNWISGYDSGWQEVSYTLKASDFTAYAGEEIYVSFGFSDGWDSLWHQRTYLDNLQILQSNNEVIPIKNNTTNSFEAVVKNNGIHNETNVEVKYFINNTLVETHIFPEIQVSETVSYVYQWNASVLGKYELYLEVTPVENETIIINNNDTLWAQVISPEKSIAFINKHEEQNFQNVKTFYENIDYYTFIISGDLATIDFSLFNYVFIGEGGNEWNISDMIYIDNYLQNGGIVVCLGDNPPSNGAIEIASNYGITYTESANGSSGSTSNLNSIHPLTVNLETIYLSSTINSLEVSGEAVSLIQDSTDTGIYGAAVDVNEGRLLVLSSDFNNCLDHDNNSMLFENILSWKEALGVTITNPKGGEIVEGMISINWIIKNNNNLSYNCSVYYWNNSHWVLIAEDLVNSTNYNWDSTTVEDGDFYLIQVIAQSVNYSAMDQSNEPFIVDNIEEAPTVTVLYPNGGELLDGTITISWTASDPDYDNLTYNLYYWNNSHWVEIASELKTTTFDWNTQITGKNGSYYLIRVEVTDGLFVVTDESNSTFTINQPPSVEIIYPNGGEILVESVTISWSSFDSDGEWLFYSLYYSSNGDSWIFIDTVFTKQAIIGILFP
jgi:thermitase